MAKETWVRVVIYENSADDPKATEKYLQHTADKVLGVFQKTKGCKFGYWAQDPNSGRMAAITYWENPESIERAKSALEQVQKEREDLGIKVAFESNFMVSKMGQFTNPWA